MKYFESKYSRYWLALVLLLAFLFRFVNLSVYPSGFNADEASFGYDAYSLLKTGKDQWGSKFPLVLKSFGDYKSPLYSYLAVPFVALLGLTEFAVRLPSVVVGVLAVYMTYLLSLQILPKSKSFFALVSAFLLAVSPWHIMLSRAAIEANLTTFFLPAGILFFLKGLKNPRLFIYSAIFFGLNLFTYHSGKLLTPIIVIGLKVLYRKDLKTIGLRNTVFAGAIFAIFFLAIIYTFKIGGGSRISERSIFQGALIEGAEKRIVLTQQGTNPTLAKVFHNKYQVVARRFVNNYKQYFSLEFATKGVKESYYAMIPGIPVIYTFEIFMFFGLFFLIKDKHLIKIVGILLVWLVLAPLPAALATGVGYSGTRASGMLPVTQILTTFGLIGWLSIYKGNKLIPNLFLVCLFVISIFQINDFKNQYTKSTSSMLYGNMEVSRWLMENRGIKNVVVSRSLSEPQIFIAFANNWNPEDYQKATQMWDLEGSKVTWIDQLPEWKLGPYTFKSIEWKKDSTNLNTLIVAKRNEFPDDVSPVFTVKYSDGKPAIYVVDTKQEVYAKAF